MSNNCQAYTRMKQTL